MNGIEIRAATEPVDGDWTATTGTKIKYRVRPCSSVAFDTIAIKAGGGAVPLEAITGSTVTPIALAVYRAVAFEHLEAITEAKAPDGGPITVRLAGASVNVTERSGALELLRLEPSLAWLVGREAHAAGFAVETARGNSQPAPA